MNAVPEVPFWRRRDWLVQTGRSGAAIYTAAVVAFLTNALVARALGPVNFGDVVLAVTVVGSIAALLDFSLEEAVVHHGASAIERGETGALRRLLRTSLRLDLVVGAGVFVFIVVAAVPIARIVSGGRLSSTLLVLAALESLASTVNGTTGATLMLAGRPDLRSWALAWTAGLRMICVLIAIHLFGGGATRVLIGYAIGAAVGAAIQGALARTLIRRRWSGRPLAPAPVGLRALASFGLHSSATTTILAARAALVAIVLGRGSGAFEVGLLSVAMLPVSLADVATSPIRTTVFAEQATLASQGRLTMLWRAIRGYTRVAFVVGVLGAFAGWFLLPALLPWLYGDAFGAATPASRLLLPAAVATLAVAWAKALPASLGRPQVRTAVALGEFLVTGGLVVWLADIGAEGVATALSVVAVGAACGWVAIARRMLAGDDRPPAPVVDGARVPVPGGKEPAR